MKRLLSIFCFLFLAYTSGAQGNLTVSKISNFPDTILSNVAYSGMQVTVVNNDTSSIYQGPVSIGMMTDSIPFQFSPGSSNATIFPGDSITFSVNNYFFDPSFFKAGDNIVVVWPIANVNDVDSLYLETYYVHVSGIHDPYSEKELFISPNPAADYFTVKFTSDIDLEQVRIYSIDGRMITESTIKSGNVKVSLLSSGVYYVYFYHRKGISVRKLLKQ